MNTTQLIAGSKVGIASPSGHRNRYSIATVAKVNGFGHIILEGGKVFTKGGQEKGGSKFYCAFLVTVEQAEAAIAERKKEDELNAAMSALKAKMDETLSNHKNGYGNYCSALTAEEKAELIALITNC